MERPPGRLRIPDEEEEGTLGFIALWATSFLGALAALGLAAVVAVALARRGLDFIVDHLLVRLLKDPYPENLWDLVVGMTRVPPHNLLELELRAERGELLERPLGSVVRTAGFQHVAFNPAQLARKPLGPRAAVDTSVVIGPYAVRPLRLETPIMVSAMGFGVGVSRPVALALARGAAAAGAAFNAGSGPLLPEVAQANPRLVIQYSGAAWSREPDTLKAARMVEVRLGHGGRASLGRVLRAVDVPEDARRRMGVAEGEEVVLEAPVPGAADPEELRRTVLDLHVKTRGVPVGVKLAATQDLEYELQAAIEAGVDFIAIDGTEGGTHASPPVIADDFGIPTAHALVRAVRFLEMVGVRHRISLIVGGGLRTPAEMLKALALGADAVYIGMAALMAVGHRQLSRAVPFEPITTLVFARGRHADEFDADLGARSLGNFLRACTAEMAEAARALGRKSIREIGPKDLVALNREAAEIFGLPPSWRPSRGSPAS
ncbi:MAG: FMN-binding glutamate synthase family protein [Firmicutes bacterium]|nr:FMN-binding glutamate synthase family protein [Bacillota bacterium]